MKKFVAVLLVFAAIVAGAGELLLRFGVISDNHLDRRYRDSHWRTRAAFEFFKKQNIRFFIDSGDVTDTYQPDMFKLWRQMYLETLGSEVDFLMIPAGHDKSGAESTAKGYAEFVKLTGSGSVNPVKVVNGYHFVSLAQWQNINILKRNLEAAVAASKPGQPVFVVTHVPPRSTTGGSGGKASGDADLRELLNKYPQVIAISGHNHSRLLDERSIWQGEFTAVNVGSLAYCGNGGIANPSDRPKAYDASIWEVYADKVVIRRFNVKSGKELFPETPWTVKLPYTPATASYSADARKNFPVPQFSPEQKPEFEPGFSGNSRWGKLLLPPLKANNFALQGYRIAVEKRNSSGKFEHFGIISFTRVVPVEDGSGDNFAFPAGYLERDTVYRITVTPVNCFGKTGTAICGEFAVGSVPWKECPGSGDIVWQPWKSRQTLTPDADGFVEVKGDVRYLLPGQALSAARRQKLKNIIVTLDIECIGKGRNAHLRISNDRNKIISPNVGEYRNDGKKQRFAFVFQPDKKSKAHYILIRRGADAKYRFTNIRSYIY